RAVIGITIEEAEVRAQPALRDRWLVVGQQEEEDNRLRSQRTWLWAEQHQRAALVLDFAYGNNPLDKTLIPGQVLDADIAFYPGSYLQRAVVVKQHAVAEAIKSRPAGAAATLDDALEHYATALACNPWIETMLLLLDMVWVEVHGSTWVLRDCNNQSLPMSRHSDAGWPLLALSGGHPVLLAAEWNGANLLPLGLWIDAVFHGV
ncbi:MAG: SWIM zinc finger family protein, partial [Chloroflexaceae bacterium]|nr:SWIM zinc finger family protein [Chloroflexaceae bacterium]